MKFNHRPNELITAIDGRKFWISRSPAVTSTVIAWVRGKRYVLLNKRGPSCPDNVGLWVLPCGYLDWDESGGDAAIRETWEECGLNLREHEKFATYRGVLENKPWEVVTEPGKDTYQNIVFHYGMIFMPGNLPIVTSENSEPGEISDIMWVEVEKAKRMALAFDHHEVIKRFEER